MAVRPLCKGSQSQRLYGNIGMLVKQPRDMGVYGVMDARAVEILEICLDQGP